MFDPHLIDLQSLRQAERQRRLELFMRESNSIEGEMEDDQGKLWSNDVAVADDVICMAEELKEIHEDDLLMWHKRLGVHLRDEAGGSPAWLGTYRDQNVSVVGTLTGKWDAPEHGHVPALMAGYFSSFKNYDAYQAYNNFEKIHPFTDLNGRIGRLIWLYKMKRAAKWPIGLSFLHAYHYQALSHYEVPYFKRFLQSTG